jgi:hypothetical protein
LELYAAIRDRRMADVCALTAPEVTCEPLVRPGRTVYEGHDGMTRLVSDLHAVHGNYQVAIIKVTEQPGPKVTVLARLVPEPGRGQPVPVRSVYAFRDGLITAIESFPARHDAVSPARPEDDAPGGG